MYKSSNIKVGSGLVAVLTAFAVTAVILISAVEIDLASAAEVDDTIPGTPYVLPGPVTGTLASDTDLSDFYEVQVTAGTTYKVTLVAPEKSAKGTKAVDFGVRVFEAPVISPSPMQPVAQAGSRRINYLEFTPATTGTYYLDAHATSGNGAYSLHFAALDPATEKCPGRSVGLGKYTDASLAPSENRHVLCFAVGIDTKKTISLHLRALSFAGAIAGEEHSISVDILDPNGNELTTCALGCVFGKIGTAAFKPSRIGLHFFRFSSADPLPSTFSFSVTKKLGTSLNLSSAASEKRKGNRYRAVTSSQLSPKQKGVIVALNFQRCNSDGLGCKLFTVKKVRTDGRGKVKAAVPLPSGRYAVQAKFPGSSKRLSSASDLQCLAVGPTGTCIGS